MQETVQQGVQAAQQAAQAAQAGAWNAEAFQGVIGAVAGAIVAGFLLILANQRASREARAEAERERQFRRSEAVRVEGEQRAQERNYVQVIAAFNRAMRVQRLRTLGQLAEGTAATATSCMDQAHERTLVIGMLDHDTESMRLAAELVGVLEHPTWNAVGWWRDAATGRIAKEPAQRPWMVDAVIAPHTVVTAEQVASEMDRIAEVAKKALLNRLRTRFTLPAPTGASADA